MTIEEKDTVALIYSPGTAEAWRVNAVPTFGSNETYSYYYWIDDYGILKGTIAKANFYFDFERIHYSPHNDVLLRPDKY
jgi:hypothetical protein